MANISMSDAELLKYAIENGIIDTALVQKKIEMQKREEILKRHPYKIWESKNGSWYTYLPDEEKSRVLKKRKIEKMIQDCIVDYYLEIEQHPCFREAYFRWIAEKEEFEEIGKNSITRYDNDFKRFFPPEEPFCKIRLCDMTDSDLEHFIKRTIKAKQLTPKSYAGLRLLIIGVFKFSKREKYTDYSISSFFRDLSLPKNIFRKVVKEKEYEVFSDKELESLMKYFNANPTIVNLGLMIEFLTGTRVGELSSLKRIDNAKRNVLKIRRTECTYFDKEKKSRITIVKDFPKTDSGIRDIILPEHAQRVLDRIIGLNPDGEYLFMRDGKRITGRMFNYYIQKACKEVGIKPRSTHKIRKTYASTLLASGVDDAIVLNQMGHSDISTTHTYYHYDITNDETRLKKINEAINF